MSDLRRKARNPRSPCGLRRETSLFFEIAMTGGYRSMTNFPMVLVALVSLGTAANNCVHAFSDRDRAKTRDRRLAWEKSKRNPLIKAFTLFPMALTPKPATTHDRLGEIRNGNGLSWRFPQEKAALTPKPATCDPLGKNQSGTRLSWRSRLFPMALTLKSATGDQTVWEKHFQGRLSWRFPHEKAGITPKPALRDPRLGKNHFGTRLSWRFRNQSRSDW